MEYRKVGRTGLKVSAFCLGTMTFGRNVDEQESLQIIQRAIDAGVNFIDTADMYDNGGSESILGKAIQGMRNSLVIASKAGHIRRLGKKYGEQRSRARSICRARGPFILGRRARRSARTTWASHGRI